MSPERPSDDKPPLSSILARTLKDLTTKVTFGLRLGGDPDADYDPPKQGERVSGDPSAEHEPPAEQHDRPSAPA